MRCNVRLATKRALGRVAAGDDGRTRLLPRTCSRSRDRGRRDHDGHAATDTVARSWARGGRLRRSPADDRVEAVRVRTSERNGTLLRVRAPDRASRHHRRLITVGRTRCRAGVRAIARHVENVTDQCAGIRNDVGRIVADRDGGRRANGTDKVNTRDGGKYPLSLT